MSGFAALWCSEPSSGREAVERMLAAAPHRGREMAVVEHGRCVLGVTNPDHGRTEAHLAQGEGWTGAFCGALDNLSELANRFGRGLDANPAGVVLEVFRSEGADAPRVLRGEFAGAVTDGARLWCFRDHLGIETLFYHDRPRALFAASEAKQVLAGSRLPRRPDLEFLEASLYLEPIDESRTAHKGMRRLGKGRIARRDDSGLEVRRFWNPQGLLESRRLSPAEVGEEFESLMAQAVRRTLSGEDIVTLSGGIDSPAVAAFAAEEYRRCAREPLGALSLVFPEIPSVDETRYIEAVAEALGLRLHTFEPSLPKLDRLPEWVRLFDGPWDHWLPGSAEEAYRFAAKLGFTSILSGEFAEYVFDSRGYLAQHLLVEGRYVAAALHFAAQRRAGIRPIGILRQIASAYAPRRLLLRRDISRAAGPMPPWIDRERIAQRDRELFLPPGKRWAHLQTRFLEAAAPAMDAHTILQAACGVRVRRPWVDVDLFEFFLSLPAEIKHPRFRSKALVRELLRGRLPDVILDRNDKTVFNDYLLAQIDYPSLERWLLRPDHRIGGVDYEVLAERLEAREVTISEYGWMRDVATVHAFLETW